MSTTKKALIVLGAVLTALLWAATGLYAAREAVEPVGPQIKEAGYLELAPKQEPWRKAELAQLRTAEVP